MKTRRESNARGAEALRFGAELAEQGEHIGAAAMAIAAQVILASKPADARKVATLCRSLVDRANKLDAVKREAVARANARKARRRRKGTK